jgi:hypothetical protein
MVQGRGGFGLALKPAESLRVLRNVIGQERESYEAVEFNVLGFVDDARAAATQLLQDAVVRDGLIQQS